jgi:ferredoxin
MPKLTIDGQTHDVPNGERLVLAIEQSGVHIGHRCGGNARCTTCRVEFQAGEPDKITRAEADKLKERGLYGQFRLACQILCDHDMAVQPAMTLENQQANGWTDTGPAPEPHITPEPEWLDKRELT